MTNEIYTGRELFVFRKDYNISQIEFSAMTNLPVKLISEIEKNQDNEITNNQDAHYIISKILDMDIYELKRYIQSLNPNIEDNKIFTNNKYNLIISIIDKKIKRFEKITRKLYIDINNLKNNWNRIDNLILIETLNLLIIAILYWIIK